MTELSECLAKLIQENSETLQKFEDWISNQPHIPKNIPRATLVRFLKVCQFDLEKAEKLLDTNVKFKIKHQYLFTKRNINSEEIQKAIKTVQFTGLPKLTKEGYFIESCRIVSSNLDDFILKDIFKFFYMIHDMNNVINPDVNGIISIYDANGFSFSHFIKLLAQGQTVLHFLQFGQESTCVDVKQIHVVNCSQVVGKLISFLKPFLTKELRDTMHFHPTGFETLHKFIDIECLPVEYDGCGGLMDDFVENTIRKLHKHSEFVGNDENFFLINVKC
ncbi:hypothetical protein ACKWTF_008925 [Chironomus riparius]